MLRHFRKQLIVNVSVLALAAACGGQPGEESPESAVQPTGGMIKVMKMQPPGQVGQLSAPSGATLKNYGGPILKNVNVVPVYWNSSVTYQSNLNSFYAAIPQSSLYDMLAQYGVGRGSRGSPYVDSKSTASTTDAAVQSELTRLFNAGLLPKPTANTYYPVHFPAGMTITDASGTASCTQWCAYHGTYSYNGVYVAYGIIPDQGGSCAGGCGSNSQRVNNLQSVASHELVEATTDPGVGLATGYSAPLAWYNTTYGEIGDICNAQQGTVVGGDGVSYVVQTEYSNSKANCVTN